MPQMRLYCTHWWDTGCVHRISGVEDKTRDCFIFPSLPISGSRYKVHSSSSSSSSSFLSAQFKTRNRQQEQKRRQRGRPPLSNLVNENVLFQREHTQHNKTGITLTVTFQTWQLNVCVQLKGDWSALVRWRLLVGFKLLVEGSSILGKLTLHPTPHRSLSLEETELSDPNWTARNSPFVYLKEEEEEEVSLVPAAVKERPPPPPPPSLHSPSFSLRNNNFLSALL